MAEGIKDILTWKDASGTTHVIEVDVIPSHTDDRTAEVTSHPIEKGANINDHIIQQPDKLTLEIAQTQTPFVTPARADIAFSKPSGFSTKNVKLEVQPNVFKPGGLLYLTRGAGALLGSLTNALGLTTTPPSPSVNVIATDGPKDRIGDLHDALIKVKTEGLFCTVTFRGRIYPDYICTKVGWRTQKGEAGLGRFTLEMQSISVVETATADLPNPASLRLKPVAVQAKPAKKAGDPTPEVSGEKNASMLHHIIGGGR